VSAAAGSVLIVEDDGNACRGLAQLLQGAGFQVRTAADGVEALEVLDREPPDLMLLDVWMPRMDGLQVLNQLKTRISSSTNRFARRDRRRAAAT